MLLLGLVEVPLWVILTFTIIVAFYWLGTWNHNYFKKRGIPGPKPWPFIGTFYENVTENIHEVDIKNVTKYGKVYGHFVGNSAELMITDEEMIAEITIKQFSNFPDRRGNFFSEPTFDHNVLTLNGDKWRSVRNQISPTFTTGKLRVMTDEINRCAKSLADNLIATGGKPFRTNLLVEPFTMDCIASTAFGLRINSLKEESNPFVINAKKLVDFNFKSVKVLLAILGPESLMKALVKLGVPLSIVDQESLKFFNSIVEQTLQGRTGGEETRKDFIQLMANAQRGENITDKEMMKEDNEPKSSSSEKKGMTKDEILANALVFFVGGFDTISVSLTNFMYNLACNQDCQKKLLDEVDRTFGDMEDVTYDALMEMQYLDQCLNESLRMYPSGFRPERRAACDTNVCGYNIKKGMMVAFPLIPLHHDPDVWPDPEKYDPERFAPERKANIKPTNFMPFGIGPRICIGKRLAELEMKMAIIQILKTHKLVTCEKTEIPLKMSRERIMVAENGVWIAVEKRN